MTTDVVVYLSERFQRESAARIYLRQRRQERRDEQALAWTIALASLVATAVVCGLGWPR